MNAVAESALDANSPAVDSASQKQWQNTGKQNKGWANIKPWTKGCPSPNPGGRPKGPSVDAAIRRLMAEGNNAEVIAQVLIDHAKKGDVRCLALLIERVDGRLKQTLGIEAQTDLRQLSDRELLRQLDIDPATVLQESDARAQDRAE